MEENLQEHLSDNFHFRKRLCCYEASYFSLYQMFALAVTVSEKIKCLVFYFKKYVKVTDVKDGGF